MKELSIAIIAALVAIILSFLFATGVTWIVCKCFGLIFTWKIALGVWIIYLFVYNFVKHFHKKS